MTARHPYCSNLSMFRGMHSIFAASLAAFALASAARAQPTARASDNPASAVQRRSSRLGLTLYGGLAGSEDTWEVGPALAASLNWQISGPLTARIDPYYAQHSEAGTDAKLTFFGGTGALEVAFGTANTTTEPYVFVAGGFYRARITGRAGGDVDLNESELKAVVGVGAGTRLGGFTFEGRLQNVAEFTNFVFLVGFRLGG